MVTQVIYATKYGHTAKLAALIADELGTEAKLVAPSVKSVGDDIVVFLTPIYATALEGIDALLKAAASSPDARLVGVTVGMSNTARPEVINDRMKTVAKNVPESLADRITWFHARGGIDHTNLSLKHKMMMQAVRAMMAPKAASGDPDAQAVIDGFGQVVTVEDPDAVASVVAHVRTLQP